ncbi:MAG: hypothetical protein J1E56_06775 [Ruminococcus sp.]|nr:hypothetical protein [Ruminococcus sp.]
MSVINRRNKLNKEKGIQISKGYVSNNPSDNKTFMWYVRVLVIFMGTFASVYSFVSGYELDYTIHFFIIISLLCGLLYGTLYGLKRIAVCVFPASALLLLLIGYINNDQLYSFLVYTWNDCADFLASHSFQIPKFSTLGIHRFNEIFVWLFISLVISLIIGFFAFYKVHFLPVFIITFVPMEIALYYGFVPDLFAVICFFACNSAVLSVSVVRLKRKYFENYKFSQRGLGFVSLIMCIFFAAALCLSNWGIAISGYERPKEFDIIRKNFSTSNFEELLSNKEVAVDLSNQSSRQIDMEEDLIIKVPLESNSVYLKCRTGSVYSDNKWYNFDSSVYDEAPVNTMRSSNITVSDIFSTSENGKRSLGLMTIQPIFDMSGFTYLPYGFYNDGSLIVSKDEGAVRRNNESLEYNVSYDKRVNNFWGELQDNANFLRVSEFPELSQSYTDFVNEHYTEVPDNLTKLKETAEELKTYGLNKRENIIDSVKKVQQYLRDNAEYSLEPGAVPNGQDFTEHFLFENKKGFCVHFATAGVMMLRAMGIPSRYASGYVITRENYKNAKELTTEEVTVSYLNNRQINQTTVEQQTVTVSLTDENAHAWAEVYIEGLGWIPCEMTAGYSQASNGLGDLSYNDEPETENNNQSGIDITAPVTEPTTEAPTTIPEDISETVSDTTAVSATSTLPAIGINVLLLILAIIVLIIVIDLITRAIIIRKRHRSFKGRNLNKNAENLYLYLEKILSYADFKDLEKENLTNAFEKIFRRFDFVDDKQCADIVKILQKLFYGNVSISKEELVIVEKFVLGFVSNFIERQKRMRKFVYKYILFLV